MKCLVHGTLLFEALLLEFAPHMPVAVISRLVREHATRIWRVLEHYVAAARVGVGRAKRSYEGALPTLERTDWLVEAVIPSLRKTTGILLIHRQQHWLEPQRSAADQCLPEL
ncbi:MAG: hypothetical protein ACYCZN_11790 [Candidatus Dormibacteria bacterium]